MDLFRIIPIAAMLALGACVLGGQKEDVPSGAQDFAEYCAACHGAAGKGDGPLAPTLARRPADLTGLSARHGGSFPTTQVMAKIWGYTGGREGAAVMPNFGPLLDSETVPYDGGDGIMSPTPLRLVQIAEHLKALNARP